MAKRFTDTTIWDDDWFYELTSEYKLFWFYIKDKCDHAGVWKPRVKSFEAATSIVIDMEKALSYFNTCKQRIRVLDNGHWFLEDFFYFQYVKRTKSLSINNNVHNSILGVYIKEGIKPSTVKGIEYIVDDNKDEHQVGDYEKFLGF
jgi:hypothetical protein